MFLPEPGDKEMNFEGWTAEDWVRKIYDDDIGNSDRQILDLDTIHGLYWSANMAVRRMPSLRNLSRIPTQLFDFSSGRWRAVEN